MWACLSKQWARELERLTTAGDGSGKKVSALPAYLMLGGELFAMVAMLLALMFAPNDIRIVATILLVMVFWTQVCLDIYKGSRMTIVIIATRVAGLFIALAGVWYSYR